MSEIEKINSKIDKIEKIILSGTKEVLTIEDCAILTGFSKSHIYRMTSQRTIPFYKPMGGAIFFKKTEIENWLLQNRQSTNEEVNRQANTYCACHKR